MQHADRVSLGLDGDERRFGSGHECGHQARLLRHARRQVDHRAQRFDVAEARVDQLASEELVRRGGVELELGVTMPKFAPAPRIAQKRSAFSSSRHGPRRRPR